MAVNFVLFLLSSLYISAECAGAGTRRLYSSQLIHHLSDEAVSYLESKGHKVKPPVAGTLDHSRVLLSSDVKRQRLKLGSHNQLLIPSQGSSTFNYGNDLGWLHYTWVDIGTPNTSFLVALDAGSDLFWLPCGCVQCAPLSSRYYSMLDRDLSEYSPSKSSTSKHLSCSHQLCLLSSTCQSPKEECPYSMNYLSSNTSSSGFLYEDQLHLTSIGVGANESSLKAPVVVGCGSKQSGDYLEGSAPDGLMGLGPGPISVLSLLAKSGLIAHSFSFCFDESYSGRIVFGDQGPENQRTTPFVHVEDYLGYFVKVEDYCIGGLCPKVTGFQAQVDSGSSFTYFPQEAYETVVAEFDKRVNATRAAFDVFAYCYKASPHGQPAIPSMKFIFTANQSFVIESPIFHAYDSQAGDLYCLGLLPMDGDIGIIGQNFMQGYRLVFDWENSKFGWSHSKCQDIGKSSNGTMTPPPSASLNPLPSNDQQNSPPGRAVSPAEAGKTPAEPSAASVLFLSQSSYVILLLIVLTFRPLYLF